MFFRMIPALLWTIFIFILCWVPHWLVPINEAAASEEVGIAHLDKYVHAILFAVFAILWLAGLRGPRRMLWVFLAGLAVAVITEAAQNLPIIGREGELADGLTDVVGLILGLLSILGFQRLSQRASHQETTERS